MLTFNENLIAFDLDAPDVGTVINVLAQKLYEQGLVTADYGEQVLAREQKHPTGLPTRPFPIAFPHADAEGVHHSALAVALLRTPIVFQSMEGPDEGLAVQIVFMLANKSPEEQIDTLRNLALLFGQPEKLSELHLLFSTQEILHWLQQELNLH